MITTKEQRIATAGTAIFCVLFLLMLVLVRFINDPTEEEEGVLVNFGDTEQGMGQVEPRPAVAENIPTPPTPSEPAPSEPAPQQSGEEEVMNQDFEESAVIEQKKKNEKKKQDDELKRQREREQQQELERQQEIERQRLAEQQRIQEEERKKQEEQQRQQQQLADAQNKAKNAFAGRNTNGGTSGEGDSNKPGNQGSLNGDPNSTNRNGGGSGNGINFNLKGRSFGSTPPKPEYNSKAEGKVVVEIRVDRQGNVISASPGKAGTTTNDPVLREAAKAAALKAKFNSDPNAAEVQVGTITYTFIQQ